MNKKLLTLCLLIMSPILAFAVAPVQVSNVVNFGDSLADAGNPYSSESDLGNNTWVQFCQKGGSFCSKTNPRYLLGAPIVNTTPDFDGKRANWVSYFDASYANKEVLPYRVYHANPSEYTDLNGFNMDFAYASAQSGNLYIDDLHADSSTQATLPYNPYRTSCIKPGTNNTGKNSCVPGVNTQVHFYLDALKETKTQPNKHTLYVFWSGGSDLFDDVGKLTYLLKTKQVLPAVSALVKLEVGCAQGNRNYVFVKKHIFSCPVNNIVHSVKTLVDAKVGVNPSNITVVNMGDLSKTPAVYQLTGGNKVALGLFSELTTLFNNNLQRKLKANGLSTVRIFDAKTLLNTIIENPEAYGFTPNAEVNQSQQDCIETNKFAPTTCQGFVWYNNKHPSSHAGKCISNSLTLFLAGKDPVANLQCR